MIFFAFGFTALFFGIFAPNLSLEVGQEVDPNRRKFHSGLDSWKGLEPEASRLFVEHAPGLAAFREATKAELAAHTSKF